MLTRVHTHTLFARGRASSPCVVFFDELDALVPRRGGEGGNQANERVVNQMLTEMDGLDSRKQASAISVMGRQSDGDRDGRAGLAEAG